MLLQRDIITTLGVKSMIDPATELRASVDFLKAYMKQQTFVRTLVLGISGGQDSTLTGKICQQTINELRQETGKAHYRFIAVRLPHDRQKDEVDCQDAIIFIQPDLVITVNIKSAVQASEAALCEAGIVLSDYVKGNIKSRARMQVQYSIAGMTSGLVVGTDHAAEAVTGFFTKYGDGGTDINPISWLNKRQGRALLQYLGCPKHLYLKIPTADLEEERPMLPDEQVLGITYAMVDDYLEGKTIDSTAAQVIEKWYQSTEHKRHRPVTILDDFWKLSSPM